MTVGLHVQKGQMAEQDYLADAEHTSHAALVREAIDRLLNRLNRMLNRLKLPSEW